MARECLYASLGVAQDADDATLKKAYRVAALANHPDKNRGADEAAAAERFKAIQHAYEVLSDPHERAWYDSHRESILRGRSHDDPDGAPASAGEATSVDLFAYFTSSAYDGFGDADDDFFAVFGAVFATLAQEERAAGASFPAPTFGGPDADWETPRDFYRVWDSFASKKTFAFADKWNLAEAPNREYRRAMERENKRERAKIRKEFNTLVRDLTAFVKKRDPRVRAQKEQELKHKEQREVEQRERTERENAQRKVRAAEARAQRDAALEENAEELDRILEQLALDEKLDRKESKNSKKGRRRRNVYAESSSDDDDDDDDVSDDGDDNNVLPGAGSNSVDNGDRGAEDVSAEGDGGSGHRTNINNGVVSSDNEEGKRESDDESEDDLFCHACHKPFRSAAQKANHEQSRKHIAAAEKLRKRIAAEDAKFGAAQAANEASESESKGSRAGDIEDEPSVHTPSQSKREKKLARKRAQAAKVLRDETLSSPDTDVEEVVEELPLQDSQGSASNDTKAERRLKRKQKRKEKVATANSGKQINAGTVADDSQHRCNVCESVFATRNKLFTHVKDKGHALRK